jgi:glycogen(starch) synthase
VHVVTCDFPGAKDYEEVDGVHVHRFDSYKIPALDFLAWIFMMNSNMIQCAVNVINSQDGYFDLIHAHDWLVARAALELKNCYRKPLISTIHATEAGRRKGIRNGYQKSIHNIESQLIHQSDGIICCSDYMAKQVCQLFNLPPEKVEIIYNGIDVSKFNFKVDSEKIKEKFAQRDEKIVLYVGRLVHEKGVHVLIGAVPKVLSQIPEAKFIIVGEGGMKESLMEEARYFNVDDKVLFTGFIDDETLKNLYKVSDVVVCPSLYEPFGIVALEAMAARTPVVVSDVGGLSEIVEHDKTGVKVYPNDPNSLAWGLVRVLTDKRYAEWLTENAFQRVLGEYNWDKIADKTRNLYRKVLDEYQKGLWKPTVA